MINNTRKATSLSPGLALLPLFFMLTLYHVPGMSQQKDEGKPPFKERIYFGGNIGLQFGTITLIEAAPLVGYRITPRLSSGVGISYLYYKDKFTNFDTHIYGGGVFTRYNLVQNLNKIIPLGLNNSVIAHLEYEGLSLESRYFDNLRISQNQQRFITHNVWVGGGLGFPLGERSSFNLFVLWNINENLNSYPDSPVVRMGINF